MTADDHRPLVHKWAEGVTHADAVGAIQASAVGVDCRLALWWHGDYLVGEQRHKMVRPLRADRLQHLDHRRPLGGIVRWRRRGGEEPRIIDYQAVLWMPHADGRYLRQYGALILHPLRGAPAPMAIEEVKRRDAGARDGPQRLCGMATHGLHMREVTQRGGCALVQRGGELDGHNALEQRCERASRGAAKGARLDSASQPQSVAQVGGKA